MAKSPFSVVLECCGCRNGAHELTKMVAIEKTPAYQKRQCGLGIVFECDAVGDQSVLVVNSMVPGGPAWETMGNGGLEVGDILHSIDGKDVCGESLENLAPMLLGSEGSKVRLGVRRAVKGRGDQGQRMPVVVEIVRKSFTPPKSILTQDPSKSNTPQTLTASRSSAVHGLKARNVGSVDKENLIKDPNIAAGLLMRSAC